MHKKQYNLMGAIVGDIVGSRFEWAHQSDIKERFRLITKNSRYTDDSCLTVAIADAILHGGDYEKFLKSYTRKSPDLGFGGMYLRWALKVETGVPTGSYANGGAMRLSPVPLYFTDLEKVYLETVRSTSVTHNHPKALDSSMLLSTAIFLCRSINDKDYIKSVLANNFNYVADAFVDNDPNAKYRAKDSLFAEPAVAYALDCFFATDSYEDAIRLAIRAGGDCDTLAAICGSIAYTYYETMSQELHDHCFAMLPLRYQQVIKRFDTLSRKK
jgi:ADP-ribosylglycohydrolase